MGELLSELLSIDNKRLYDGGFQFYQTGLIRKVLEATGMDHCNGFPTATKVEASLGTDANGYEAKIKFSNSYASIIGMMLYLTLNTRSYFSFAVNQWYWFIHKTKVYHDMAVLIYITYQGQWSAV